MLCCNRWYHLWNCRHNVNVLLNLFHNFHKNVINAIIFNQVLSLEVRYVLIQALHFLCQQLLSTLGNQRKPFIRLIVINLTTMGMSKSSLWRCSLKIAPVSNGQCALSQKNIPNEQNMKNAMFNVQNILEGYSLGEEKQLLEHNPPYLSFWAQRSSHVLSHVQELGHLLATKSSL